MVEKSGSGPRRRTAAPRKRSLNRADGLDQQSLALPDEPEVAPIQDAFDEVAAFRSGSRRNESAPDDGRPTEAEMDFDADPAPRPVRTTRTRAASRPATRATDEADSASPSDAEIDTSALAERPVRRGRPRRADVAERPLAEERRPSDAGEGEFASRESDREEPRAFRDDVDVERSPRPARRSRLVTDEDAFGGGLSDGPNARSERPTDSDTSERAETPRDADRGDAEAAPREAREEGYRDRRRGPRFGYDRPRDAAGDAGAPRPERAEGDGFETDGGDTSDSGRDGSGVARDDGAEGGQPGGDYIDDGNRKRRRRRRRTRNDGPYNSGPGQGQYAGEQRPANRGPNSPGAHRPGQHRHRNQQSNNNNFNQRRTGHGQNRSQFGGTDRGAQQDRGYQDRNQGDRGQVERGPRGPEVTTAVQGIMELHPKGYGFLREQKNGYYSQDSDAFISSSLIEKFKLRAGVHMTGEAVSGARGQGPRLKQIDTIEGRLPEQYLDVRDFDSLTAINPFEQIRMETGPTPITMRVVDLLAPIGKGQRALIVAPPRSGKTMLLQEIADSVSINHPEIHLIVLLIDERPEEVTEMKRRVKGEVIASSLDREVESHIRVSQLVFERAKRMAESGRDVFVLLDSITRTARAFNKWSNSGRTQTGGLDIRAMDTPKKMFGMARRFEEGGSLTVVGTALVDTGSRMDDAIFQEFKGTGNMELVLSRDLADRRIWPAIDISKSGTRREEKILAPAELDGITLLRRSLISMSPGEAMEQLVKTLAKYPTNADFLARVRSVL